jgi:hypothetical protein
VQWVVLVCTTARSVSLTVPGRLSAFVDIVASIAMIVAAAFLVWKSSRSVDVAAGPGGPAAPAAYNVGDRLNDISGVDFTLGNGTLVLYVRSTCRFCTASMGFYRTLVDRLDGVRLAVVGSEPETVLRGYMSQHSLVPHVLVSVPPGRLKFAGTPTLALLDSRGTIRAIWRGQLTPDKENEVRRALQ